jgi:hypothetical protein
MCVFEGFFMMVYGLVLENMLEAYLGCMVQTLVYGLRYFC